MQIPNWGASLLISDRSPCCHRCFAKSSLNSLYPKISKKKNKGNVVRRKTSKSFNHNVISKSKTPSHPPYARFIPSYMILIVSHLSCHPMRVVSSFFSVPLLYFFCFGFFRSFLFSFLFLFSLPCSFLKRRRRVYIPYLSCTRGGEAGVVVVFCLVFISPLFITFDSFTF